MHHASPRDLPLAKGLQRDDVVQDRRDVGLNRRCVRFRRSAVPAEGARDLVEPVNLGENARNILFEHAVEVRTPVRAPQMLHAQSNGRERILDFVRHLSRHLTPRQHTLRARELGDVVQGEDGTSALEARQLAAERASVVLDLEAVRRPRTTQKRGDAR